MTSAGSRSSARKRSLLAVLGPPVLVVLIVAAMLTLLVDPAEEDLPRDADLCPLDDRAISSSAVFLADLRKPLAAGYAKLPGDLIRDITRGLGENAELQVFSLAGSSTAPRTPVYRLCKPYGNADLRVREAKDQSGAERDCDDLPAQLPVVVRDNATRFCAKRSELEERLNSLAAEPWPDDQFLANAYLVEAIEDIRFELAKRPPPHSLFVLSDMMQHAPWYSHLDMEWTDWRYDAFSGLFHSQGWAFEQMSVDEELQVEVFYLPRRSQTDQPRTRELHQQFWREHFAGADVTFHNQPPMPAYRAVPLMNVPSDADIAAQERAAIEQLLREVQQERERLLELEAERTQRSEEAGQIELALQRQAEERRQRLEEQEQARLQAEREAEERREAEAAAQREAEAERALALERQRLEEQEQARLQAEREAEERREAEAAAQREAEAERALALERQRLEEQEQARLQTEREAEERRRQFAVDQDDAEVAASSEPVPPIAAATSENLPPCEVIGSDQPIRPNYPRGGSVDAGNATMVVRYTLNEQGETIDDEVETVTERSSADSNRWFPEFAREAVQTVKKWTFRFQDTNGGSCIRHQTLETTFHFAFGDA